MNPIHLKTFLVVQKHLNYSRAAEELYLSQPAVSRQVKQLENLLGLPLFEQIGKTLHLTDAGRTLVTEAGVLLAGLERVMESVAAHKGLVKGRIRIGASTTPGFYLLPQVIGEFHRQFPEVDIQFAISNSTRLVEKLIRNEIDIGFVGDALAHPDLQHTKLIEDTIVGFVGARHRLARLRTVDPAELKGEVAVFREEGSATRQVYDRWLRRANIQQKRSIQLHCPEAVKMLVASGFGYSFMSIFGLRDQIKAKSLVKLRIPQLELRRPISIVRHKDKHESPTMKAFVKLAERLVPTMAAGDM